MPTFHTITNKIFDDKNKSGQQTNFNFSHYKYLNKVHGVQQSTHKNKKKTSTKHTETMLTTFVERQKKTDFT